MAELALETMELANRSAWPRPAISSLKEGECISALIATALQHNDMPAIDSPPLFDFKKPSISETLRVIIARNYLKRKRKEKGKRRQINVQ